MIRDQQCQRIFDLIVKHKDGLTTKQARELSGFMKLDGSTRPMPKGTFHIHTKHLIKDGHISKEKNEKKASNCKTTWHARLDPMWEQQLTQRDTDFYGSIVKMLISTKLTGNKIVNMMPSMICFLSQIYVEAAYFLLVNNDRVQYNALLVLAEKKIEEFRVHIEKNIVNLSKRAKQEMADNFSMTSSIVTQDWAKRLNYNRRFPKKNKTPYDIRAELDLTFPTTEFERVLLEVQSDNTGKYVAHQQHPIMKIIDKNPNDFRKLQEDLRMRIMVNKLIYDKPEFIPAVKELGAANEYYAKTGKAPKAMSKDAVTVHQLVYGGT